MLAIALVEPGCVAVIEWPERDCGPDEVTVRMRAVGLCGSDLMVYRGATPVPAHPWVLGHEGGGEVVAVGAAVTGLHVGQRVVIEPNICCFACAACESGRTSSCEKRRALGIRDPGIAAQRVTVPAEFCWPVPDATPDTTLAGFEPHAVARAAARRAGVRPGDNCLVVGAGSQGLMMCLRLLALGAHPQVIEPHDGRRELAAALGAPTRQDRSQEFAFVFETSGAPTAFRAALDATAAGGQLVLIGQHDGGVAISTRELVQRQITIRGSLIYDHPGDFADEVAAAGRGDLDLTPVMRARYAPADANRAFAEVRSVAGKSWIDLTQQWPHAAGEST